MGFHRATRPEVRQTLRARAEAISLITNIIPLNCWIHCNTKLCACVRMCLVCCSRWWVIGWRGEYTVRATDVSLGASCTSTLMIHCESDCGGGLKLWRRPTGRDSCYCVQEALLFWLIYTVFLAEADSCLNGDEIPCRLCNLKVTATVPYSEPAEFNPNHHTPLRQDLDERYYVACRKLII